MDEDTFVRIAAAAVALRDMADSEQYTIQSAARAEIVAWARSLEALLRTPVGAA